MLAYLSGEITDDIGSVSSPQGPKPFILNCSLKTITNALVGFREPTSFKHLVLVLNQKLNTLNRSSSSFGYSSRYSPIRKSIAKLAKPFSAGA